MLPLKANQLTFKWSAMFVVAFHSFDTLIIKNSNGSGKCKRQLVIKALDEDIGFRAIFPHNSHIMIPVCEAGMYIFCIFLCCFTLWDPNFTILQALSQYKH